MSDEHKQILLNWHKSHGTDGVCERVGENFRLTETGRQILEGIVRYHHKVVAKAVYEEQLARKSATIWDVLRRLRTNSTAKKIDPTWLKSRDHGDIVEYNGTKAVVVRVKNTAELWAPDQTAYGTPYWAQIPESQLSLNWEVAADAAIQRDAWRTGINAFDGGAQNEYLASALGVTHWSTRQKVKDVEVEVVNDDTSVANALMPGPKRLLDAIHEKPDPMNEKTRQNQLQRQERASQRAARPHEYAGSDTPDEDVLF